MELRNIKNDFHIWTTNKFAYVLRNHSFNPPDLTNPTFPMTTSYQDFKRVCFSRNTSYNPLLDKKFDEISLDLEYLRNQTINLHSRLLPHDADSFEVYLHSHGELIRAIRSGQAEYKLHYSMSPFSPMHPKPSNHISTRVSQITRLHKREGAVQPCDPSVDDEDNHLRESIMNKVGCTPVYWMSITQKQKVLTQCTSSEQFKRISNYLYGKEGPFNLYTQPCKRTTMISHSERNGFPSRDLLILRIEYRTELFTKITNDKAMGFEAFWGGIGGFIGIFLGYSLMQLPDLVPNGLVHKLTRIICNLLE